MPDMRRGVRTRVAVVASGWASGLSRRLGRGAAGPAWAGDTLGCPRCGEALDVAGERWRCSCGLGRPVPRWHVQHDAGTVTCGGGAAIPVVLGLPGRFNLGNAALALAAAAQLGVDPAAAAAVLAGVQTIADRYRIARRGAHELRLLLAKNPAGWSETLRLLEPAAARVFVVNAGEADGRDTSWLWDVAFEVLAGQSPAVVAAGDKAADIGLRLGYAGVEHVTVADPLAALAAVPAGKVDVVATYTAFRALTRRLGTDTP